MQNKYYDQLEKKDGFYELEINSFDDFINLLRPDNRNIDFLMTKLRLEHTEESIIKHSLLAGLKITDAMIPDNNIVFRGHGDSEWLLESTFHRNIDKTNIYGGDWMRHHFDEYKFLKLFQDSCDLTGVYLPSDGNSLRIKQNDHFKAHFDAYNLDNLDWFSEEFFELAAFAQHYGVPTRLLDWSKNPFVACYFACSYAIGLKNLGNSNFCIWILNSEYMCDSLGEVLKVLDLPKGVNQHIAHQQGVLSYIRFNSDCYNEFGSSPTLDKILKYYESDYRLLKVTLNCTLAPQLFSYCNGHNFNAGNLFRGAHGAALHTKDLIKYDLCECVD